MTTTFENAIVGDRVWSTSYGWGEITKIVEKDIYPICVQFSNVNRALTFGGVYHLGQAQTLFWDEVKIIAPEQPASLPKYEVDTLLVVDEEYFSYFSHFDKFGGCWCYANGKTSFTEYLRELHSTAFRLPTENELKQKQILR